MKKTITLLLIILLSGQLSFSQTDTSNAHWMSGNWGLGTLIWTGPNASFNVDQFINQVAQIEGPSHILVNLTKNANGDRYSSPHSVLEKMGPNAVPPTSGPDILMEIAQKIDSLGLKLMVYVATEGPAKLKGANSYTKAHDYDPVTKKSQFVDNWRSYVLDSIYVNEPGTDKEKLRRAFAEIVIAEYAERFGDLIDLWWFDHAVFGDIHKLDSVIASHNPNGAVAFNTGQKVPLKNNSPGYEDCTFGHVTPVSNFLPNDSVNLPMVTSIENSTNNTGYFGSPPSLGHISLPAQERWFIGGDVWDEVQARNWMSRALGAKGSITWTVRQQGGGALIDTSLVSFLQKVAADCSSIPSGSLQSDAISISLIDENILEADSNYTGYQWYVNDTLIPGETNQYLSNILTDNAYAVKATHVNGCVSKSETFALSTASIREFDKTSSNFFPNPVTSNIIHLKGVDFDYLQIHSFNGALLHSQQHSEGSEVDISVLKPGIYAISFFRDTQVVTVEKLIRM